MTDLESLADFFVESNKLKRTLRYSSGQGEKEESRRGIKDSSAEHSWQLTLMVQIVARELGLGLNIQHSLEIANVHDLGEYVLEEDFNSYLVATGVLSKAEKEKSEETAMSYLRSRFVFGPRLYSLWREYQECKTPEARFVKALDKIESHIHIIERGRTANGPDDARYQIVYADDAVRNFPELEPFLKVVKKKLRPVLEEKEGMIWKEEYNYPD